MSSACHADVMPAAYVRAMSLRLPMSAPRLVLGPALLWGLVEFLALSRASLRAVLRRR